MVEHNSHILLAKVRQGTLIFGVLDLLDQVGKHPGLAHARLMFLCLEMVDAR